MNKKVIALLISGMSVFSMHHAMAENTSSMRFIGSVTVSACDIDTSGFSSVNLPSVTQKDFGGAHTVAGAQNFTVKISGCPNTVTKAKLRVTGTTDSRDNGLLAIDKGEGMATGVAIQLLTNGMALPVNSGSTDLHTLVNGETTFDLTARYVAVDKTVVAGGVAASAQVDMTYI